MTREYPSDPPPLTRVVFLIDDLHRPNGIVSATDLLATEMRRRGLDVDLWCFGPCDDDLRDRHHVVNPFPGRRLTSRMAGFERSRQGLRPVRRVVGALWWPLVRVWMHCLASSWDEGTMVIGAGLESTLLVAQAGVRPRILVSQVHEDVSSLTPRQCDLVRQAAQVSRVVSVLTPSGIGALAGWGLEAVCLVDPAPPLLGRADPATSQTVVYLGRLARAKQVDHLIEAFAAVAPAGWKLRIYGDGPARESLEAQARASGADIALCGTVQDIGKVLRGAAIHALPSRAEGLGMSVLEANMVGLPTVAYDCTAGIRMSAGPDAFLVPNGDRQAFQETLGSLMSDAEARARAGELAFEYGQSFAAPVVVNRWFALWGMLNRPQGLGREQG